MCGTIVHTSAGKGWRIKNYEQINRKYTLEDAAEELEELWGMETNLVGEIKDLFEKFRKD